MGVAVLSVSMRSPSACANFDIAIKSNVGVALRLSLQIEYRLVRLREFIFLENWVAVALALRWSPEKKSLFWNHYTVFFITKSFL
jgi:hypothetical protein